MGRSKWKILFTKFNFIRSIEKSIKKQNIISRSSIIVAKDLNLTYYVHNGKSYDEVTVTKKMIGHKFGEFSLTRKFFSMKQKKQKKRRNVKKSRQS